jgi:TonB family protein
MPLFLFGGVDGMYTIINKNIKYPKSALNDNIQGKVIVQFVVDTLGKANDFEIIKSVRDDVDEEALRVTRMLDRWEPATQNGKKVKVVYSIPITFSIQQSPKKSKTSEHLGMAIGAVLGIALVYGLTKILY